MAPKREVCTLSFMCPPDDLDASFGDKVILVTVERYFYRIYGEKLRLFSLKPRNSAKSAKKYLTIVTEITLSQKEVSRSPGWHMKDNGHTYIFCPILIFDNKSKLGARLD